MSLKISIYQLQTVKSAEREGPCGNCFSMYVEVSWQWFAQWRSNIIVPARCARTSPQSLLLLLLRQLHSALPIVDANDPNAVLAVYRTIDLRHGTFNQAASVLSRYMLLLTAYTAGFKHGCHLLGFAANYLELPFFEPGPEAVSAAKRCPRDVSRYEVNDLSLVFVML